MLKSSCPLFLKTAFYREKDQIEVEKNVMREGGGGGEEKQTEVQ